MGRRKAFRRLMAGNTGEGSGIRSSNFRMPPDTLKSIEGALGLPCLNPACDSNVNVMADSFGTFAQPSSGGFPQE